VTNLAMWARLKSPWVIHFNSGACNGCDIEIVALLTPKYDVEPFGIKLEPTPRHADVLLVSGSVTKQCAERLKRIYEQMPQPKFVLQSAHAPVPEAFSKVLTVQLVESTKSCLSTLTSQGARRDQKQ